jgi:ADP-ribosylglycohydrolase
MLGAIAGDIIGSVYEPRSRRTKCEDFPLFVERSHFTDDTVLTVATADCLLHNKDYALTYKQYGWDWPHAGYGGGFKNWVFSEGLEPYNSFGNGSAMRVSPVGFAAKTIEKALAEAERSAAVTHNHPEGIKGAQSVAAAIFLARRGSSKEEIRDFVAASFNYDLGRTLATIRPDYYFDVTCQGSVPEAIIAFLESSSVEDAIRKAISLGGDSDTQACIAGGIAEAFYGKVPDVITNEIRMRLPEEFLEVIDKFTERFIEK